MMWIRCICLTSLLHIVDSMFSVAETNKNKRESLDEIISFPSKRQRSDEMMETSQIKNVLDENDQRKLVEQGTSKYLEDCTNRGNPDLVIDEPSAKPDNVHQIVSEVAYKKEIEDNIEEFLKDRKSVIERVNNPTNAYCLVKKYMESVFGETGEQIENGKIDYATKLLDWFSESRNVKKLELKRYDLTCGFLRAFLSIFGFSEMRVSCKYEGLITIVYREGNKKTNDTKNTNGDVLEYQDYLKLSIPHVNTIHILGNDFKASLTKKGLDETKIYAVLTAWLREIKIDRFIYSWEVRHKNKIYLCIIHHNISNDQKEDIIVVNVGRIIRIDANYIENLSENYFPFVISKPTNFQIIVGCSIAFDLSFIDSLVGNTLTSKCEIIFMSIVDLYNFYNDIKEHGDVKNLEYGVKLNNGNFFSNILQECNNLHPIGYAFWNLDTKVSKIDVSHLKNLRDVVETDNSKGLKRFTMVFPSQDSKLETVPAFFEVFGNNNGIISVNSHRTLQNILIKYIELDTLEDLEFLNKNLQQLYITLDSVLSGSCQVPIKKLEVHFIYEEASFQEKNVLDINNFAINSDEMALISKLKVDKLNLRNVIFSWNRRDKECLDVMESDKESRWHGKIYSENSRYTMKEKEQKETRNERIRLLNNTRNSYRYKKRMLRKRCTNSLYSDSWLNKEESNLMLERNNKTLKIYEDCKTLWDNISTEWIVNGLEHFGKK